MVKAAKKEEKVVAKNYKMVIIKTLIEKGSASGMELAEKIRGEMPFLGAESAYKVKAEYVMPTLEKSQCFVQKDTDLWSLSDVFLNLENHAHSLLKKNSYPMSIEGIKAALTEKHKNLSPEDIPLNLSKDERFYELEVGGRKYVFLQEWELCNRYALSVFMENGNKKHYSCEELVLKLVSDYKKKKTNVILMLDEDEVCFRAMPDNKYSAVPRYLKKQKIHDVPKNVLDTICTRLEEKRSRGISLYELSEELLGLPLPMTKLISSLEEDPRFIIDGFKVKRSKLSLADIDAAKKEQRRLRNVERKLLREEEKKKKEALQTEMAETVEMSEVAETREVEPKKFKKVIKAERVVEQFVVPIDEIIAVSEPLETLPEAEEPDKLADITPEPEVKTEAIAAEALVATETVGIRKKLPLIRKFVPDDEPPFDVAATGVDMEELSDFLRELVELDGMVPGLTPIRFDDLLRQCLSLRVSDYKFTNPCVADFMVNLARPRLDHIVVDLVCGRGDILLRVLQHVKNSLRRDHQQDIEMFTAFCDEQLVGFDISEFLIRSARLLLTMNGFEVSLLDAGNSLDDQEMLIDEMFSLIFGDFSNFNNREIKGFLTVMKRLLQKDGRAVFLLNDDLLPDDGEILQVISDSFHLLHRITFTDYEGVRKSVMHIGKGRRLDIRPKVYEIESLDGLARIMDIVL